MQRPATSNPKIKKTRTLRHESSCAHMYTQENNLPAKNKVFKPKRIQKKNNLECEDLRLLTKKTETPDIESNCTSVRTNTQKNNLTTRSLLMS